MRQLYFLPVLAFSWLPFAQAVSPQVLQVLVGQNKPPYIIQKSHSGYELDLIRLAATQLGFRLHFVYVPNGRLPSEMHSSRYDLALLPEHSAPHLHWSTAVNCYSDVIVRRNITPAQANSWDSLRQQSVYAFQGASQVLGAGFTATIPAMRHYLELADQSAQVEALFKGRVDAIVLDHRIFHYFYRQLGRHDPYQLTPLGNQACYALASVSAPLAAQFSAAIVKVKAAPQYQQLLQQYFTE